MVALGILSRKFYMEVRTLRVHVPHFDRCSYNPIPRTVLIRDFLSPTYDPRQGPPSLLHLSVLFSMFSIGILVDLSRTPNSPEAKMYRDVAKIPLDIEAVSKDTSIVTLEALIMYAQAVQWSDDPNGPANAWTYLSLSVTLGESVSPTALLYTVTNTRFTDRTA